ncbi:MAG: zinc ABC transporter substrate-binding protein [Bacteroides sp.]|nr:zinc ABC transporter substrate-binding protein [Bacteroides sp.]MBQ8443685.1 zinc ABC transporter substrate-binding protein [Bacteroides sp.]
MKKLFYILIILVFCACGNTSQKNEKPIITVTLEPLRYFTEAIAGDYYQVVSMVPKGSSPETYDPTPQQLVNLSRSQAYLRIGYIGFEQTWMKKLEANCPDMKVFDTSQGIDLIRGEGHWHGDHFHEGGVEPHVWNSTRNAYLMAENIYTALCELDAAHQADYQQRLEALKQTIRETEENVLMLLEHADSTFLIYHPALSYFARDYGLKQISIEEGGKEPSPAQLKALIETCRKEHAHTIFVQQEFDQRNAQLIADELGVNVVSINPLSYDWAEEMIRVAKALKH